MNISSVSMNSFRSAKSTIAQEVKASAYRAFDELIPETTAKMVAKKENKNIDKFIKSDVNFDLITNTGNKNVSFISEASIF